MRNLVEPIKSKKDIVLIENDLSKHNIRNQLIWVFGTNTGLRISDVLGLNVEDVRNRYYVEIIEKKTKKYKRFPLNKKLRTLIKEYLTIRDKQYSLTNDEPLFVGKKHKRLDRSQVYRFIVRACKDNSIKVHVSTHTLRRSFGYHHYQKFKDPIVLQKIFNHSSQRITLMYIGVEQDEIDLSYKNFEL